MLSSFLQIVATAAFQSKTASRTFILQGERTFLIFCFFVLSGGRESLFLDMFDMHFHAVSAHSGALLNFLHWDSCCFSKLEAYQLLCTVGNTLTTDKYIIQPRFRIKLFLIKPHLKIQFFRINV